MLTTNVPQLCNEYAWIWLWRDGTPSKITQPQFDYFCGVNATPVERREFQAYWKQIDTEWLRVERTLAGVLSFTYLTNNYGFTGDWFMNPIKDLVPGITLKWLKHAFAPVAVFLNLQDQRYMKYGKYYEPGQEKSFDIVGVNDLSGEASGQYVLKILDHNGRMVKRMKGEIAIPAYGKKYHPVSLDMPNKPGGYLVLLEFYPQNSKETVVSRRYVKVGSCNYSFYNYLP